MRDFHLPGRSPTFAVNGACATSHPLAARVAVQLLEEGGNAVDAAIGAAILLGICEPQSAGIGGDCFTLVKPANGNQIVALNGSGRAPMALSAEKLRASGHSSMQLYSPDAVTIPGAVDGFCRLSEDWGRKGMGFSLTPVIHYAEEGVPISPRVAFDWTRSMESLHGNARQFYLFNGSPPKPGDVFRAAGQAEVLRRVGSEGRKGFYEGDVACDMVDSLQALGGIHTMEDFASASCEYTTPISGTYKGFEIVEHPPNGQGAAAILLLNILANLDLPGTGPFGTLRTHLETEAAKLALDARDRYIADFDSMNRLEHVLSTKAAERLSTLIDPQNAMANPRSVSGAVHKDTVYLTVVDRDQMAVSLIYSVYHGFGSGLASSRFGINFQNRGAGFNLIAGHPNEAQGGKRPLHTIIPAMLKKDGRPVMPFGVMGGNYQAVGHARFVSNLVDFGMDPQQAALDGPRSFPDKGELRLERGYSSQARRELSHIGHTVVTPEVPLGGGQAILIDYDRGVLQAASDHRKDGCALGY